MIAFAAWLAWAAWSRITSTIEERHGLTVHENPNALGYYAGPNVLLDIMPAEEWAEIEEAALR